MAVRLQGRGSVSRKSRIDPPAEMLSEVSSESLGFGSGLFFRVLIRGTWETNMLCKTLISASALGV